MDYEKFQSFGHMPLTPDVLIVPSELRYFVKVQTSPYSFTRAAREPYVYAFLRMSTPPVLRMWSAASVSIPVVWPKARWVGPTVGWWFSAALPQKMEREKAPVWLLRWLKSNGNKRLGEVTRVSSFRSWCTKCKKNAHCTVESVLFYFYVTVSTEGRALVENESFWSFQ